MAKVKSAGLRNYVGRLGGSVYYMNKGQNIGRELAPEVSNPRTPAQMRQRMKWANLVNIYKANRSWMGHLSFEAKPQIWSDYNAYMSANIGQNPVYLTKQAAEAGDVVLAPYIMTKGSLPVIEYAYSAGDDAAETNIAMGNLSDTFTVAELAAEIVGSNPEWQYGDQLSIVFMYRGTAPNPIVDAVELILDPEDNRTLSEVETAYSSLDNILYMTDTNTLGFIMGEGVSFVRKAICIVHSRTTSGRTAVSTQSFLLNTEAMLEFIQMGTDEQFNYAADSYGMGSEYFLSAGYQDIDSPEAPQSVTAVMYAGEGQERFTAIEWMQDVMPQTLSIQMRKDFTGQTPTLTVGGVSITVATATGRVITAEIDISEAESIGQATAANRKIVVTIAGVSYAWA